MSTYTIRRQNFKTIFINFNKLQQFNLKVAIIFSCICLSVCFLEHPTSVDQENKVSGENSEILIQSVGISGGEQNKKGKMNKLAIFGGTGMTGRCAVTYSLEKGEQFRVWCGIGIFIMRNIDDNLCANCAEIVGIL